MAGVVRLSGGRLIQKYFCSFSSQSVQKNLKSRQRLCFHTSPFLSVLGQEIKMPSLSPTMTEGTIVQWLKKEGDPIAPGDVLCEIQTDKAVMAFETEEEGVLAKILLDNGSKDVKVGTLIGLIVSEGEDYKAVEIPSGSGRSFSTGGTGGSGAPASAAGSGSSSGSGSSGNNVKMPSLSPTMTEGTIVSWKKKEGDKINPGDVLCEIQTDKAVMAFEMEEEGILAKILVPEGTAQVKVGTVIAITVEVGEDWKTVQQGADATTEPVKAVKIPTSSGAPATAAGSASSSGSSGNDVKMPALSPTMTEGTIVSWKKKEGDTINPGDALCEIQTDKAVMTFEMEEEGILAKILVPEGTMHVKVGSAIAITVEVGQDWKNLQQGAGAEPEPEAFSVPIFTGGTVPGFEVKMPSLSPTMTEGQIVNWLKKEGDKISPGDVLCEIQTDKAVMSFEIEDEGILAKILAPAGSGAVKVGTLIALFVEEGKDWKQVAIPAQIVAKPAPKPAAAKSEVKKTETPTQAVASGYHLVGDFAPAVRALLETYHLTGKEMAPSGRKNRLLKGDVLKYITNNKLEPKPPVAVPLPGKPQKTREPAGAPVSGPPPLSSVPISSLREKTGYTDIEITTMRRTIAKRLTLSKTEIPHAYCSLRAEIDQLMQSRKQLVNLGIKVSINDFVIKAVASALKQCPYVNTHYVKEKVIPSETIDISIAVATENGLITPIVKNADMKSVDEISAEVAELAGRARKGKLQLHEFQGGSFTISNLGMFGIKEFSAIINPPQCAILAVGGGNQIIKPDGKPGTFMYATLSYDGRAISEDEVAAFMEILTGYIENPATLLLKGAKPKYKSKAIISEFL